MENESQKQEQGIPSVIDSLRFFDVIGIFEKDLEPGTGWLYVDAESMKIKQKPAGTAIDHTKPWIFTNPNPELTCNYFQAIFRNTIKHPIQLLHPRCLGCYKVVVKIHTVQQLMYVHQFQVNFTKDHRGTDRFCKCGFEDREYVHYRCGAYFYNKGLEQGLERHQQVLDGLRVVFGNDAVSDVPGSYSDGKIEVVLKRGCTEYELAHGPSDKWEMNEQQQALLDKIESCFEIDKKCAFPTPDFVAEHTMFKWMCRGWETGDPTAKLFNSKGPFYTPPVTYHKFKKEKKTNE